jgi:hypothetical protein
LEVLGPFVEVWARCPAGAAVARKPDLYRRAPDAAFYESGEPELVLDTGGEGADISAHRIVRALEARGLLEPPLAVREMARSALLTAPVARNGALRTRAVSSAGLKINTRAGVED